MVLLSLNKNPLTRENDVLLGEAIDAAQLPLGEANSLCNTQKVVALAGHDIAPCALGIDCIIPHTVECHSHIVHIDLAGLLRLCCLLSPCSATSVLSALLSAGAGVGVEGLCQSATMALS